MFKKLFKKTPAGNTIDDIVGILDPNDLAIVVTDGKVCEIEYANPIALTRLRADLDVSRECKAHFVKKFPGICEYCPYEFKDKQLETRTFDIEDTEKRLYSVRRNTISRIDGKAASIFIMRDTKPEKDANERLYSLAYTDQLTNIPNRLKLKDDFNALAEQIANGEVYGAIALFDLDHFKAVNDTYGHNTGDAILRRLTEYLQSQKQFAGHLYRLGGDEFVLMFSDSSDRFSTTGEMESHYKDVISTALRSYTLPHIELSCTLSIGLSFFPKNGDNMSDVLRKADIALYQAKAAGRNKLVLFEDTFDTAQKFKDVYINIQPILLATGKTYGYALTDGDHDIEAGDDENTVNLNVFNSTVDALGLKDIENDLHYFISFSRQLLNPVVHKNLPKEKFIVQIQLPPVINPDILERELQIYNELRNDGYKLALVGLDSNKPVRELLRLADYCKFCPSDTDVAKQKMLIARNQRVKFIAFDVDTQEDFHLTKNAGFHLFQGYYFSQPEVGRKTKAVSPLKANYFRLLKLSSTSDYIDFHEISEVIAADVALSYKLLCILNSAAVGLKNVTSIESALAYIGEESVKKWIAVLALRGIVEDKPIEIVRMSLIRARFGELLSPYLRVKRDSKQVFLVSMLSLLHIALEKSKEELISDIHVTDDIRESLLTKNGAYSDLLRFYEDYEYSNWESVTQFVEENHLDPSLLNDFYISALQWYHDLTED